MKIIHTLPAIRRSGGITLLQNNLFNLTCNIRHQIWANKIPENIHFHNADILLTRHSSVFNFYKILERLKKENRNNTIIHIHGRNGFFVLIAAKIMKIKIIYQAHGYYYKLSRGKVFSFFQNFVDSCLLKYSDFVLFTADGEKEFALKNYNLNPNYKVIYNRTNPPLKKSFSTIISKDNPIIYCLATSNIHQKGLDRQLSLIKKLKFLNNKFKLIHYFNIENQLELNYLRNKIRTLGLSKHYFFKKASKNVWDEIHSAGGIILSTSRYEGRNLVIQEAFHNMVPVVATDCLGQKELLKENHAFILKENKIDEWANTLNEALSNQELISKKVQKANNWILQFGDMKIYSNELFDCYKHVLTM